VTTRSDRPAPAAETTTAKGKRAEDAAAQHLEARGYRVVARNVHAGGGEIDLIAQDGDVLCFVEVRRRKKTDDALVSVSKKKQAFLVRAATAHLARTLPDGQWPRCRFDVVVVRGDDVVRVEKDAFVAEAPSVRAS
jgi:putative endonuclease